MSQLQFCRASYLARVFNSHANLYFRIELCSILCNSVDRMLNADWSVVIVVFVLLLFALIYFNLFNLFNLEMEWSDTKTLQLIEL